MAYRLVFLLLILVMTACSPAAQHQQTAGDSSPENIKSALESISTEDLLRHTRVLASDE